MIHLLNLLGVQPTDESGVDDLMEDEDSGSDSGAPPLEKVHINAAGGIFKDQKLTDQVASIMEICTAIFAGGLPVI